MCNYTKTITNIEAPCIYFVLTTTALVAAVLYSFAPLPFSHSKNPSVRLAVSLCISLPHSIYISLFLTVCKCFFYTICNHCHLWECTSEWHVNDQPHQINHWKYQPIESSNNNNNSSSSSYSFSVLQTNKRNKLRWKRQTRAHANRIH